MAHFRFRRSFGNVGTRRFRGARPLGSTPAFSAEAQNYFSRLDAAGDTTYTTYKQPLANYIDSLVAMGGAYWDDMKSSTSFVGVGIQGITVPLRDGMTVPTNNNFVASDLDQTTGLLCNGTTKRISTNTNQSNYAQNDTSVSVYRTEDVSGANPFYFGTNLANGIGARQSLVTACYGTQAITGSATTAVGLIGLSRSASTGYDYRSNGTTGTRTETSATPAAGNLDIFAINGTTSGSSRLATYHAGPALDLATLEGLQATLISEIVAAKAFAAAASYFSRLVAAGDTTHVAYKQPLTNYITSLVELGGAYWDTMLSATSFVGVGIQGVTVPLRDGMTVPTQSNFVASDLDQLTGLKGDGSTKYINTNLTGSNTTQDDVSTSVYLTAADQRTSNYNWNGNGANQDGSLHFQCLNGTGVYARCQSSSRQSLETIDTTTKTGFCGLNRASSTTYNYLLDTVSGSNTVTSQVPLNSALSVFTSQGSSSAATSARLATYHYGPALNLATLENLQETLLLEISAI